MASVWCRPAERQVSDQMIVIDPDILFIFIDYPLALGVQGKVFQVIDNRPVIPVGLKVQPSIIESELINRYRIFHQSLRSSFAISHYI
jgi:hypothetical protein